MNAFRVRFFLCAVIIALYGQAYGSEYSLCSAMDNKGVLASALFGSLMVPQHKHRDTARAALETVGVMFDQGYNCINPISMVTNFAVNLGVRKIFYYLEEREYIAKGNNLPFKSLDSEGKKIESFYLHSPLKEVFKIMGPQIVAGLFTMTFISYC